MKLYDVLSDLCVKWGVPYIFPYTDSLDTQFVINNSLTDIRTKCEECLSDYDACVPYVLMLLSVTKINSEESIDNDILNITNDWYSGSVSDTEKQNTINYFRNLCKTTIGLIDMCDENIPEHRKNLYECFRDLYNADKDFSYPASRGIEKVFDSEMNIRYISWDIPDGAYYSLFLLYAEAIKKKFNLDDCNNDDDKISLFHCLQRLYFIQYYHSDDSVKKILQTDNELDETDREIVGKTYILDMITGRESSVLEEDDLCYRSTASISNDYFSIVIDECGEFWNIGNCSKEHIKYDDNHHIIWTDVDDRFRVKLKPTDFALYRYFFDNPDTSIKMIFDNREMLIKYLLKYNSGSEKLEKESDKDKFLRNIQKSITDINKEMKKMFGVSFSIVRKSGVRIGATYYVPISVDEITKKS